MPAKLWVRVDEEVNSIHVTQMLQEPVLAHTFVNLTRSAYSLQLQDILFELSPVKEENTHESEIQNEETSSLNIIL